MARRRRLNSEHRSDMPMPRETSALATALALAFNPIPAVRRASVDLPPQSDLRRWSPSVSPVRRSGKAASVRPVDRGPNPDRWSFVHPETVAVCVRRKSRKQVLHARGIAGGPVRKPRRSRFSKVRC